MTFKTILVPTDFSEPSTAALDYAKQLADAFNASIHLLHVVQDPARQPWILETYGVSSLDVLADIMTQAQRDLEHALPESERKTHKAELVTAVGSPFGEILDYARKNNVDVIVMGTHGRGALAHALLGSVTERVVRFAPCPVLTVRANVAAGQGKMVVAGATAGAAR
jgi:nucleotide-binding universal stress UspA family protein